MKLKYPYYKQNSALVLAVVTTVDGETEYRINCKRINGVWYVKNKHLQFVNDEWVLKSNLVFDHELQKEMPKDNPDMVQGAVSFSKDGDIILGYFTRNPYNNCIISSRQYGEVVCIDYSIIPSRFYVENISTGYYIDIRNLSVDKVRQLGTKQLVLNNANHSYNIEDNAASFDQAVKLYKNSEFPVDIDIRLASRFLGDVTFGAELETINGTLPQHLLNKYGIIICKDGSIRNRDGAYPPEYVTVPLSGAKGVQTLRNVAHEIGKRSDININCSYHLHMGNLNVDRMFIVTMFKLCTKIQDDVFAMFPYYKTNPNGIKEKNYCKKLPQNITNVYEKGDINTFINDTYTDIFSFLSGGIKCDDTFNRNNRRSPWPEGKWNIKTRYYWINFVNLLFSKRDTVEFRIHTPTLNPDKIVNWLFICNAICKFAQKYPKLCVTNEEVKFTDVLRYYAQNSSTIYAHKLSENLIDYYNNRCKMFAKDLKNRDHISNHELQGDLLFRGNALLLK